MPRSFIKNEKKCKELRILLKRTEKNTRTLRSFEKNGCPCPILECAQKLNKHMWVHTKKSTRKCECAEKSTSKCEFTAFHRIIDMQVWVRAEKSTGKCECTKKHLNYKQVWVCTENLLESLSMLRNIHKQASAEQTSLKSIFIFIQYKRTLKRRFWFT